MSKAPYPNMAPVDQYLMEDREAEIALARSAAPESISRDSEDRSQDIRKGTGRDSLEHRRKVAQARISDVAGARDGSSPCSSKVASSKLKLNLKRTKRQALFTRLGDL